MTRVLIVDDERDFRNSLSEALTSAGHEVTECNDAAEAVSRVQALPFDVVITDLRMPGQGGLDLLKAAAGRLPDAILLVMTAYGSMETAIEALRIGAHDYLLKPFRLEALVKKVELLVRHQAALAENRFLRATLENHHPASGLVGKSSAIERIHELIGKVAPTESTVMILGETGTGKELVARAIHAASPRRQGPFVAINCGGIPDSLLESELFGHVRGSFTGADRDKRGLFEVAENGSILLDEVGEMPLALQSKILRALENREILRVGATGPIRINARIIAATHRNLQEMLEEGSFRSDLYYRLNVFEVSIPALRDRSEDILPIAACLLEKYCRRMNRPIPALEPSAVRAMEHYRWPGNVRELANVLERALILSDGPRITLSDLPGLGMPTSPACRDELKVERLAFERSHIRRVLGKFNGDKSRAAEALGIDLSSLYRKLQE